MHSWSNCFRKCCWLFLSDLQLHFKSNIQVGFVHPICFRTSFMVILLVIVKYTNWLYKDRCNLKLPRAGCHSIFHFQTHISSLSRYYLACCPLQSLVLLIHLLPCYQTYPCMPNVVHTTTKLRCIP